MEPAARHGRWAGRGPQARAASWAARGAAGQLRSLRTAPGPAGFPCAAIDPPRYSRRSRDTGPTSWTILTLPAGRPSQQHGTRLCPKGALHPQSDRTTSASPRRLTPTGRPEYLLFPSPVTPTGVCAHSQAAERVLLRRTRAPRRSPGKGADGPRGATGPARRRASPLCPKVEGTVRRARPPGGWGPCSEGSRHAIGSFAGTYQVLNQGRFKRDRAPPFPAKRRWPQA